MKDEEIVALYWQRNEDAIQETSQKYGAYLTKIAHNVLSNPEDSEECVNDTYLRVWEAIPPQCPEKLSTFLGKITRNLALNRYKYYLREKRGNGQTALVIDEINECIPALNSTEEAVEEQLLVELLNQFLYSLPVQKRKIFLRRYWYMSSIQEIAKDYGFSESKVKMILLRTRNKLKQVLEKEGIVL